MFTSCSDFSSHARILLLVGLNVPICLYFNIVSFILPAEFTKLKQRVTKYCNSACRLQIVNKLNSYTTTSVFSYFSILVLIFKPRRYFNHVKQETSLTLRQTLSQVKTN